MANFRDWFDARLLRAGDRLRVATRRPVTGRFRSDRVARRTGASVEFAGHRPYAPGDDPRSLDWNAYGRSDRLYTRLFHDEEDMHVCLLLDVSESMRTPLGILPPKLRQARRLAAVIAHASLAGQHQLSIGMFSESLDSFSEPVRGRASFHRVLELLGRTPKPGRGTSFASAIPGAAAASPRRSMVVVISDFLDSSGTDLPLRALLHRRCDVVLVQITDHLRRAELPLGNLSLVDAETGAELSFAATPQAIGDQMQEAVRRMETLRRWAIKHGVPLAEVESGATDDDALRKLLRAGILVR